MVEPADGVDMVYLRSVICDGGKKGGRVKIWKRNHSNSMYCKPVQNSCILRLLKLSGVSRRTVLRANPVFEQLYLSHVKTLKMTGSNYFHGRKFYFISCMSLEFINGYVCRYLVPRESN